MDTVWRICFEHKMTKKAKCLAKILSRILIYCGNGKLCFFKRSTFFAFQLPRISYQKERERDIMSKKYFIWKFPFKKKYKQPEITSNDYLVATSSKQMFSMVQCNAMHLIVMRMNCLTFHFLSLSKAFLCNRTLND